MHLKTKENTKIAITMGDLSGIGPELIIRTFEDPRMLNQFTPVIYGSVKAINFYRRLLNIEKFNYTVIADAKQARPMRFNIIDCVPGFDRIEAGIASQASGQAAFTFLEAAVQDLKSGVVDALVTLPIDKSTIQNTKFTFPGHTEYLAAQFGVEDNLMLMVHHDLRIATVTGHIPVKEISSNMITGKIYGKLILLNQSLKVDFNLQQPKIAVLGLNPHAGDHGLLGKEDKEKIETAVNQARDNGMFVMGPFPADGFFGQGLYRKFDAVLAMYHDQGLIPFKLMCESQGVNFTAGMPVIRTSPDHGTAYDIAGKGVADDGSFRNALYLALDLYHSRKENLELAAGSLKAVVPAELMMHDEVVEEN